VSALPVANLALVAAYAGFQWTIRALVYPQFALVPPAAFPGYERRHQQRVSRVVGPLFAGQAVTTGWLLVTRTTSAPVLTCAACLAVVLGVTGLLAVPLHRRLDAGWDAAVHRRLLRVDTVRALAATAGTGAAVWLALGG
jgi:hypothetical protein